MSEPRTPSPPVVGGVRLVVNFVVSLLVVGLVNLGLEEAVAVDVGAKADLALQATLMALLAYLGKRARDNPDRWYAFLGSVV